MKKKILVVFIMLLIAFSIGYTYYNQNLNAASALNVAQLKTGYQVVIGTDASNQEIIWDVHAPIASGYTLSTKTD